MIHYNMIQDVKLLADPMQLSNAQAPPARGADVPRIRAPFKRAMTFAWGLVRLVHLVHGAFTALLKPERLNQVASSHLRVTLIHFLDLGSLGSLGSLGKVVGGGNYVEHQSLQDWAQNSGRQAVQVFVVRQWL